MAQNDLLKRSMDAGISFTNLTQRRAEALVKELVKAGEVQADQAHDAVIDLLERSRKNSERLIDMIAKEVRSQIKSLGLASQDDLARVERRVAALRAAAVPGKKATAKKATVKKAAPKKAPAKRKAPAKKATAAKKSVKKA